MAIWGTHASETIDAADGVTEGDDFIYAMGGDDTVYGLGGNDTIFGGIGADTIDGGPGIDTVTFSGAIPTGGFEGIVINLATGRGYGADAEGDRYYNIENVNGSAQDDRIYGDGGSNTLDGRDGGDLLKGAGGNDRLFGGDGADTLEGGAGADLLDGGEQRWEHSAYPWVPDTASYASSPSRVFVSLMHGRGDGGDAKGDVLVNIENLTGSAHDDTLWGDNDVNQLEGLDGNDTLNGLAGADTLIGGAGNDVLIGGDRQDILTGGRDADTFVFTSMWDSITSAPDHVTDFARVHGDRIDLSAIDANTATAIDDPFHWIGNEVPWDASGAGQLRFRAGYVEGDMDGDGNADLSIQVSARDPMDRIDFIL